MGLQAADVATKKTLQKVRGTLSKIAPSLDWDHIEAEYTTMVEAELAANSSSGDTEAMLEEDVVTYFLEDSQRDDELEAQPDEE